MCRTTDGNDSKTIELIYHAMIREQDYENSRKSSYEKKANFFMTTLIGVISFFLLNIELSKLNEWDLKSIVVLVILFPLICITLCLIGNSFYYFMRIYSLERYKRLDLMTVDEDVYKFQEEKVQLLFIGQYAEALEINATNNDEKAIDYTLGLRFFIISIICAWLLFIVYLFL